MRSVLEKTLPATEGLHDVEQCLARLRLHLIGFDDVSCRRQHRNVADAGIIVQCADGGVAKTALRRVDDALEGKVVGRLADETEISHGIADFEALVEARAADDAVVEAERDEAIFELAHLEGGAHQDRHVVEIVPDTAGIAALKLLDLLADGAGFLL